MQRNVQLTAGVRPAGDGLHGTPQRPSPSRQRDGSFSASQAVSRLDAPVTPQKAKNPIE